MYAYSNCSCLPLFVEERNHLPLLSSPTNSIRGNKLMAVTMDYGGADLCTEGT